MLVCMYRVGGRVYVHSPACCDAGQHTGVGEDGPGSTAECATRRAAMMAAFPQEIANRLDGYQYMMIAADPSREACERLANQILCIDDLMDLMTFHGCVDSLPDQDPEKGRRQNDNEHA